MQYAFSLSVLFVCLTTSYADLMISILVIEFHKPKELMISEVLVVADWHV